METFLVLRMSLKYIIVYSENGKGFIQYRSHCQSQSSQGTGYTGDRITKKANGMMRQCSQKQQEAVHAPTLGLTTGRKWHFGNKKLRAKVGTRARLQENLGPQKKGLHCSHWSQQRYQLLSGVMQHNEKDGEILQLLLSNLPPVAPIGESTSKLKR